MCALLSTGCICMPQKMKVPVSTLNAEGHNDIEGANPNLCELQDLWYSFRLCINWIQNSIDK